MTQEQLLDLFPKEANSTCYINAVNKKIITPTQSDTQLTPKHCEVAIWALKKDLEKVPTGSPLWQHITCLISLMKVMKEPRKKSFSPFSDQLKKDLTEAQAENKQLRKDLKKAQTEIEHRETLIRQLQTQPLSIQLRKLTEMACQLEIDLESEKEARARAEAKAGAIPTGDGRTVHIHANTVNLNDIHHNDNNNTQINS